MPEPLLLKSAEAAKALAISLSYLAELKASGEIPCVKIGASVRYDLVDLRKFIEAKKSRNSLASPEGTR
jgi:excisionase family DNA binding protein